MTGKWGRERDEAYAVGKTKKEKKSKEGFDNIGSGTIALFTEIYINLPLFQKYVEIYHFLGTQVFHGTRVP